MVLATLLLLCAIPQADDAAKVAAASNANVERQALSATASDNTSKDAAAAAALPSAPAPRVKPEVEPAPLRSAAQPFQPVRPVTRPGETPRQRKIWYGLMAAAHPAPPFDPWSTRPPASPRHHQAAN